MIHMTKPSWELGPHGHSSHIPVFPIWRSLMSTAFQDRGQERAIKPIASEQCRLWRLDLQDFNTFLPPCQVEHCKILLNI